MSQFLLGALTAASVVALWWLFCLLLGKLMEWWTAYVPDDEDML